MITAARRKNAGLFFCPEDLDCDCGVLLDEASAIPACRLFIRSLKRYTRLRIANLSRQTVS
jgi:hypothetical protein